jgi:hypothetical protein
MRGFVGTLRRGRLSGGIKAAFGTAQRRELQGAPSFRGVTEASGLEAGARPRVLPEKPRCEDA